MQTQSQKFIELQQKAIDQKLVGMHPKEVNNVLSTMSSDEANEFLGRLGRLRATQIYKTFERRSMVTLAEYVQNHTQRGACTCGRCLDAPANPEDHQPKGHTADVMFFKVAMADRPDVKTFKSMVNTQFPHRLAGEEHSYIEMGANIGDQGIALTAMALGHLLGIWQLLTPTSLMSFLPDDLQMQMAGQGMVTIKAE